jgi:hypothetical protein
MKPKDIKTAFDAWKAGTALSALCREHGVKRRELMMPFRKLAGGRDAIAALRAAGAGGQMFGGKRAAPMTREERAAKRVRDDQGAVVLHSLSKKKGWSWSWVWDPVVINIAAERRKGEEGGRKVQWRKLRYMVFTSPKGNQYVEARATERADVLVMRPTSSPRRDVFGKKTGEMWVHNFPSVRLRKLKDSVHAKRADQEQKALERGIKMHEKRRRDKKKRREQIKTLARKLEAEKAGVQTQHSRRTKPISRRRSA